MSRAVRKKPTRPALGTAGEASKRTQFKRGRKPHNARPASEYQSVEEIVKRVGSEPRRVRLRGEEVEMSRAERTMRLQVERALEGKVREVAQLVRLMVKYPQIARSYTIKKTVFISGADALL